MRTESRKFPIVKYFLFLIFYFSFFVILASCGKKGEPTLKSYEKPDPPSNLSAIHRESEIILSWGFPKNNEKIIKGFYLMKSKEADFERIFLEADKRAYRDKDFEINHQYKYKIISQNLRGILSDDSNVIEIEPKALPLPPGKPVYKIEYDFLTLTWQDVGNGISYNIYKSEKKGVYTLAPLNTEPIKGTSFRDSFDIKKTVHYTIRSLWGGTVRDEGPPSEELEVNPSEFVPSAPEGLRALTRQEGVQLLWKEASETWVIGYRVYRVTDKKEGVVFIGETSVPSYFDKEKASAKRNYRVTALGPSKEGPASEIKDVVFVPYR